MELHVRRAKKDGTSCWHIQCSAFCVSLIQFAVQRHMHINAKFWIHVVMHYIVCQQLIPSFFLSYQYRPDCFFEPVWCFEVSVAGRFYKLEPVLYVHVVVHYTQLCIVPGAHSPMKQGEGACNWPLPCKDMYWLVTPFTARPVHDHKWRSLNKVYV